MTGPAVREVKLSQMAAEDRWEAEFFHPQFALPSSTKVEWKPLGPLLTLCQYGSSESLNEAGVGYPIFRLNEIRRGLLTRAKKFAKIPEVHYEELKLERDDILFCRTNGNPHLVGRTGMLKEDLDACFASYLVRVRTNRQELKPEYLTVYLATPAGRLQIERRATRSNQTNLSAAQFRKIPVPIPSDPSHQETVAELFNKHAANTVEARQLYLSAAQALEVELGITAMGPEPSTGAPASFSDMERSARWDSEYFRPWIVALVEKIEKYPHGSVSLLKAAEYIPAMWAPEDDGPFPYVELSDINPEVGLIDGSKELSAEALPGRARRILQRGDVLVSAVAGSSEKAALVDDGFAGSIASNGFLQLRSQGISEHFLMLLLRCRGIRLQLEREATGGILSAVSSRRLLNIVVPDIPLGVQKKLGAMVLKAHEKHRAGTKHFEEAVDLVQSLTVGTGT